MAQGTSSGGAPAVSPPRRAFNQAPSPELGCATCPRPPRGPAHGLPRRKGHRGRGGPARPPPPPTPPAGAQDAGAAHPPDGLCLSAGHRRRQPGGEGLGRGLTAPRRPRAHDGQVPSGAGGAGRASGRPEAPAGELRGPGGRGSRGGAGVKGAGGGVPGAGAGGAERMRGWGGPEPAGGAPHQGRCLRRSRCRSSGPAGTCSRL